MKAFIPLNDVITKFLFFYIKGNDQFLKNEWVKQGATVESVEADLLKNGFIVVPPIEEQKGIVFYIDSKIAKIQTATNLKQSEIAILKEYKATLINAAVTGKVRV